MTVDELHGTLKTCETRIEQEDLAEKEATFKVSNKKGTSRQKSKSEYNSDDDDFDNEEEANFVRKLKRGTGKYKGKLPLKCFECGRINHFASKCPYKGNPNSDDKNNYKTNRSFQRHKKENNGRTVKSKNLYSKEDSSSSDDDSDSDNDSEKVLFVAIDTKEITDDHDEFEEEGEVDLEVELISA